MGAAASAPHYKAAARGVGAGADDGITVVCAGPSAAGPGRLPARTSHEAEGGEGENGADGILRRLAKLRQSVPLSKSPVAAAILERAHAAAGTGTDGEHVAEGLRRYLEWQRAATDMISRDQEELLSRMDAVEELSSKLAKRMQWTSSVVASSVTHLKQVTPLQVEMARLRHEVHAVYKNLEELSEMLEAPETPQAHSTQ